MQRPQCPQCPGRSPSSPGVRLGPHGEAEVQNGEYLELVKLDGLHPGPMR